MNINNKNDHISFALWVPLVWYFVSTTRSVSFWFGENLMDNSNFDYLEGNPFDRNFYTALILIGLFVLINRRPQWSLIIQNNLWIIILFIYMLFSIIWSDFQEVALKRWIKTIGAFIMALLVLTEYNPFRAISILLRRCFFVHLPLDVITIKYFRDIGVAWSKDGQSAMWTGLTTHKNVLGEVCMTSGLYFFWDFIQKYDIKRKIVDIFYLLIIAYLMSGPGYSRSTTAIVVLLVGIVVLFGLKYSSDNERYTSKMIMKFTVAAISFVLFLFLGVTALEKNKAISVVAFEEIGRDSTFTGRTELWGDILAIAYENPVFGVGYGSFWIGDKANNLWEKYTWQPGQGHNGYIDVYVELGLVGMLLFVAVLYSVFQNIRKTSIEDFEYYRFRMTIFAMILVHNITESSFLRSTHNIWFLFLLIAVNIPATVQKSESTPLEMEENIV